MSFIEDLGKGLTYAFPVVAAANGLGDIGDAYWGGNGPGNAATGGVLQGGGIIPGLGGGGNAPTAAQLTPEQQASIAGGYTNPSTGAPVVGYTQPVTQGGAIGAGQSYGATPQPIYGPSVRDQAMAGFNAGPREAPQMQGAQMAQPANVQGATINTGYMQPGQQTSDMGKAAAYGSLGAARDARGDGRGRAGIARAQRAWRRRLRQHRHQRACPGREHPEARPWSCCAGGTERAGGRGPYADAWCELEPDGSGAGRAVPSPQHAAGHDGRRW
jgi:hypothetical protein